MADGRIGIQIEIEGADDAKDDLKSVSVGTEELGRLAAAAAIPIGATVAAIGAMGTALVQAQNEFARQRDIFSGFTGNIAPARQALGGLVSDLQIMQTANEAARRGLHLSGEDLRNVMVAAFQQAERTGADFNTTLDQLVQAVGRGAPRALQQFGIEADNTQDALSELGREFGDTTVEAESFEDVWQGLTTAVDNGVTTFFQAIEASGELDALWNALTETLGLAEIGMSDFSDAAREAGIMVAAFLAEALENARENLATFVETYNAVTSAIQSGDISGAVRAVGRGVNAVRSNARSFIEGIAPRANEIRAALAAPTGPDETTGGGGGGRGRRPEDPYSEEAIEERMSRDTEYWNGVNQAAADAEIEANHNAIEAINQARDDMADEDKRRHKERLEQIDEQREALKDAAQEARDKLLEANQQIKEDAEGTLGPVVSGLTKSLAEVVAGTKSADEAFQGLLSSFLEMIAQETALQAAKEFAEAIAAFARYDYSGGAQHIAAGVAYTAVAVAAGAASIAVAPPASSPASPEQSTGGGQQGGNSYTINIMGTIATAATHAELGRDIKGYIDAADSRYGAAA